MEPQPRVRDCYPLGFSVLYRLNLCRRQYWSSPATVAPASPLTARSHSPPSARSIPSSSSFEQQHSQHGSDVDEDLHCARTKSEVATASLAKEFLLYVLVHCRDTTLAATEVTFRAEPIVRVVKVGYLDYKAVDDGGLWEQVERPPLPWQWLRMRAVLEAKNSFAAFYADAKDPLEHHLPQSAEAISMLVEQGRIKGNWEFGVFIIAVIQHCLCFIHYKPSPNYLDYIADTSTTPDPRFAGARLLVQATQLLSLDSANDTLATLGNLFGLLSFWATDEAGDESSDQSGDQRSDGEDDDEGSEGETQALSPAEEVQDSDSAGSVEELRRPKRGYFY
ncbi:hypothetical protein QBC46DRAFT_359613 [Diplogelasinospora grovesii]|uniref:Uncharacterized protein n=1 Tax=Diplogelasinospora grovesii TaxID=303347 RepID=A0AAN6MX15_9PEZI|nr:hypothetical protein QBC46DRAFT_359613 [Diplogelasinospora grovesii]